MKCLHALLNNANLLKLVSENVPMILLNFTVVSHSKTTNLLFKICTKLCAICCYSTVVSIICVSAYVHYVDKQKGHQGSVLSIIYQRVYSKTTFFTLYVSLV